MGVAELLKHVKALSDRQRREFFIAALALDEPAPKPRNGKTKRVKWPDIEARARRIFGQRVLPNLVLLERDEESL